MTLSCVSSSERIVYLQFVLTSGGQIFSVSVQSLVYLPAAPQLWRVLESSFIHLVHGAVGVLFSFSAFQLLSISVMFSGVSRHLREKVAPHGRLTLDFLISHISPIILPGQISDVSKQFQVSIFHPGFIALSRRIGLNFDRYKKWKSLHCFIS